MKKLEIFVRNKEIELNSFASLWMLDNLSPQMKWKLEASLMCFYRRTLKIQLTEQVSNMKALKKMTTERILVKIRKKHEKRGLGKLNSQMLYRGQEWWEMPSVRLPVTTSCEWKAEQCSGGFTNWETLLRATTNRKLCFTVVTHVVMRHDTDMKKKSDALGWEKEKVEGDIILVNRKIFGRHYTS